MSESRETLLKRLKYRSWHRGCKETDIVLGNFADKRLEFLTDDALALYQDFLEELDGDIWNWLAEKDAAAPAQYAGLLAQLKTFIKERMQ